MKKLFLVAPVCLLALVACKSPRTSFPNPTQTIQASAKSVGDLIEKDGPEIVAKNHVGPEPLDPSNMKVVRDGDVVSVVMGHGFDVTVSCDFTITPQGNGCNVTAVNGWQKDGHAKSSPLDTVQSSHETKVRSLIEIKRRAEGGK